jgi:hypothetical protein
MMGIIQAHNLNLQKAINAYFENPDALQQQVRSSRTGSYRHFSNAAKRIFSLRMNGEGLTVHLTLRTTSQCRVSDVPSITRTYAYPLLSLSPAFNIENSDDILGKGYSAPPSRPPSRMNTNEVLSDLKNNGMGAPSSGAGQFDFVFTMKAYLNSLVIQQTPVKS